MRNCQGVRLPVQLSSLALLLVSAPGVALPVSQDRDPVLKNVDDIRERLAESYPLDLQLAGVSGTATLTITINERGRAVDPQFLRSSGVEELDAAALDVVDHLRFDPAERDGDRVSQRLVLPLEFFSSCGSPRQVVSPANRLDVAGDLSVSRMDALASGRVRWAEVEISIDTNGVATGVELLRSTGDTEMDEFVLRIAMADGYDPVLWEGRAQIGRFRRVIAPTVERPPSDADRQCDVPGLRNGLKVREELTALVRATRRYDRSFNPRILATLWIESNGRVGRVHFPTGSCWDALDNSIRLILAKAVYEPAVCSGVPSGTWVAQPVHLN